MRERCGRPALVLFPPKGRRHFRKGNARHERSWRPFSRLSTRNTPTLDLTSSPGQLPLHPVAILASGPLNSGWVTEKLDADRLGQMYFFGNRALPWEKIFLTDDPRPSDCLAVVRDQYPLVRHCVIDRKERTKTLETRRY